MCYVREAWTPYGHVIRASAGERTVRAMRQNWSGRVATTRVPPEMCALWRPARGRLSRLPAQISPKPPPSPQVHRPAEHRLATTTDREASIVWPAKKPATDLLPGHDPGIGRAPHLDHGHGPGGVSHGHGPRGDGHGHSPVGDGQLSGTPGRARRHPRHWPSS